VFRHDREHKREGGKQGGADLSTCLYAMAFCRATLSNIGGIRPCLILQHALQLQSVVRMLVMCRTPSSHRASEEVLYIRWMQLVVSRGRANLFVWPGKQNVRYWIGKCCCRTACEACNFLSPSCTCRQNSRYGTCLNARERNQVLGIDNWMTQRKSSTQINNTLPR
jgi:hypothetical protein